MTIPEPTVLADGLVFPEGPRWHNGKLWFSDMFSRRVMTLDLQGRLNEELTLPADRPSGLGFLPDGRLLVVSMEDRLLFCLDPDGLRVVTDFAGIEGATINDMVVDGQGRAYIGNRVGPVGGPVPMDTVVLVTPDGSTRVVADEIAFPNGSVITADGRTYIVAETQGHRLAAFDIDADGGLSGRRVYADLGEADPDGICVDAEGAVWVASPATSEFLRVQEGGNVTDRIRVQDRWAVACALGGSDRRTLFLSTSRTTGANIGAMVKEVREHRTITDPFSKAQGAVETVTVDVPGAGWP